MTTDAHSLNDLEDVLRTCDGCVLYDPLKSEPDYRESRTITDALPANSLSISNGRMAEDPFLAAIRCAATLLGKSVFVLIPGRKFDQVGTRHGSGGGWYDRFLSRIPSNWIRVGVSHRHEVSRATLNRKDHDQVIDWLLVRDGSEWRAVATRARS